MDIQRIPVAKISIDPKNARKHSAESIAAIAKSLEKFGQQKPIVLDQNMVCVAGNGTFQAAKRLGWVEIQCVVSKLTDRQRKAYAIADNKTAEMSAWDRAELPVQLNDLWVHERELFDATGFIYEDLFPSEKIDLELNNALSFKLEITCIDEEQQREIAQLCEDKKWQYKILMF